MINVAGSDLVKGKKYYIERKKHWRGDNSKFLGVYITSKILEYDPTQGSAEARSRKRLNYFLVIQEFPDKSRREKAYYFWFNEDNYQFYQYSLDEFNKNKEDREIEAIVDFAVRKRFSYQIYGKKHPFVRLELKAPWNEKEFFKKRSPSSSSSSSSAETRKRSPSASPSSSSSAAAHSSSTRKRSPSSAAAHSSSPKETIYISSDEGSDSADSKTRSNKRSKKRSKKRSQKRKSPPPEDIITISDDSPLQNASSSSSAAPNSRARLEAEIQNMRAAAHEKYLKRK